MYESKEWSSHALRDYVAAMGVEARLIDMQKDVDLDDILSCRLILNRVFASAVFRGHQRALDQAEAVIGLLQKHGVPMINPAEAHYYETSKDRAAKKLAAHGFPVPKVYGVFLNGQMTDSAGAEGPEAGSDRTGRAETERSEGRAEPGSLKLEYPCVLKPDCGGRTTWTFIVNNDRELREHMAGAPAIRFIVEEYVRPEYGYVTRIEVIGGKCRLALKRGVAENGLSAYHLGSDYAAYRDLPGRIEDMAVKAMSLLSIEAGSLDIIENRSGAYIIDVNSVSNASEDNTEMFGFDLMKETAGYAVQRYRELG